MSKKWIYAKIMIVVSMTMYIMGPILVGCLTNGIWVKIILIINMNLGTRLPLILGGIIYRKRSVLHDGKKNIIIFPII